MAVMSMASAKKKSEGLSDEEISQLRAEFEELLKSKQFLLIHVPDGLLANYVAVNNMHPADLNLVLDILKQDIVESVINEADQG